MAKGWEKAATAWALIDRLERGQTTREYYGMKSLRRPLFRRVSFWLTTSLILVLGFAFPLVSRLHLIFLMA